MWAQETICVRCRNLAAASAGACRTCGRWVARVWASHCTGCAKHTWPTGSCQDCLAWSISLTDTGRCRACREFIARNLTTGPCRGCQRQLNLNRSRRCRLCAAARRHAHLEGDPHWDREPTLGTGIQLFIGELPNRRARQPSHPDHDASGDTGDTSEPLRLFVVAEIHRPEPRSSAARAGETAADLPAGLAAELNACAQARGWNPTTIAGVIQALAILTRTGSFELDDEALQTLHRRRVPIGRVREFLTASGLALAVPTTDPVRQHLDIDGLPAQIRAELHAWVEILQGRIGRHPPRSHATIANYLTAVRPALALWAATHHTLREITTDEIETQLGGLQGSRRTLTTVALRSLFAALKSRRMVFIDPARTLSPGRFPHTPVLGLDDHTRAGLLAATPRPDHRLVVLLAGVHALSRADIIGLDLDDLDLDAGTLHIGDTTRPLDRLVIETTTRWLTERRRRWPASANPHLLVSYKSAYGLGPISTGYFRNVFAQLPTTAAELRADRLLTEARIHNDPLRLVRLFGIHPDTAVGYCTDANLDRIHSAQPDGEPHHLTPPS